MISMPTNVCSECYQTFTAAIESRKADNGVLNTYCSHNAVLLTGEMMAGLLVNWSLLPCPSLEYAHALFESARQEWAKSNMLESVANSGEKH